MSRKRRYQKALQKELERLQSAGKLRPGTVQVINVEHDSWCNLLAGKGPCNCNPSIGKTTRLPQPHEGN